MANLISVGVNGLLAHQSALSTTGNNITNANTPGYSRQRVEFATLPEQRFGAGYLGQGVEVNGIARIVDQFLVNQLRFDTSAFHSADTLTHNFEQLDTLLSDPSTGVAPAMQSFFDALQQATLDPTSIPIRQVVLSTAGTLAQRFNSLYGQLQSQERVINEQLSVMAGQVTTLASGIAALNQQISQQLGGGAQPNALIDKRDEMVRELAQRVGVGVVDQGGGMVNIFIGNGQPLVVGNSASQLVAAPSAADPSRYSLSLEGASSGRDVTELLKGGGEIGGLLQYRREGLDSAFNELGRLALSFADAFNDKMADGFDLDGEEGGGLFADINSSARMSARSQPTGATAGSVEVEVTRPDRLTGQEYLAAYDGATWTVTTLSGESVDAAEHGFGLEIGVPPGSTFRIRPSRNGADDIRVALTDPRLLAFAGPDENGDFAGISDNTNALAMAELRLGSRVGVRPDDSGGLSFSMAYGAQVSSVGARTAELKIHQESSDTILAQSQANRDATSGVNLDEEAANLIKFEQAYNASAQVISVARSLFDSLIAAFR